MIYTVTWVFPCSKFTQLPERLQNKKSCSIYLETDLKSICTTLCPSFRDAQTNSIEALQINQSLSLWKTPTGAGVGTSVTQCIKNHLQMGRSATTPPSISNGKRRGSSCFLAQRGDESISPVTWPSPSNRAAVHWHANEKQWRFVHSCFQKPAPPTVLSTFCYKDKEWKKRQNWLSGVIVRIFTQVCTLLVCAVSQRIRSSLCAKTDERASATSTWKPSAVSG